MPVPRLIPVTPCVRPFTILFAALALSMSAGRTAGVPEPPAQAGGETPRSVVFVVDTVRDWPTLVESLPGDPEVVVLDGRRDGLSQMADRLVGRHGLAAIHVLSHGDVGRIQLGSVWLDAPAAHERRRDLAAIGHALRPGGDLLLYGCAVAADGAGLPLLDAVARETGADVAASADATGAASRGGNWSLEITHGAIEATPLTPTGYDGLLVAFTDPLNVNVGTTPSFTSTLGGVSFTYAFTSQGDGGDIVWESIYGAGNSPSVNLASASYNIVTTERVTITRTDLADFSFGGLYVNNSGGETVTVAGYRDGTQVGSSQLVPMGAASSLSFGELHVDEVRITTTDFFLTNIDDFSGNTDPPSTAPSLSATAANPAFTEGGSAVDLFQAVTATTNDGGQTFSGMTLTVTNVSNGASEVLSIAGTSIALTNGTSGALSGGGSYSVAVAAGTATVTLSGLARSDAQMGTLVDGLTYANGSQDPGTSNRVVTVTGITDSGGSNNTAAPNRVSTVSVAPVNDAPTMSATAGTPTFTENGAAVDLFSGVTISAIESGQTITALSLTAGGLADGSSEILVIDGTSVALTHGNSGTTATNSMSVLVAVSGGTATVTVSKGAGISPATAQTLIDNLTYRHSGETPTTGARTVTITSVRDSGGTSNGGVDTTSVSMSATVTVASANDAPVITAPGTIAVTEDVATTLTGISFSDVDAGSGTAAATLATSSGTFGAVSGAGVAVAGSGTGTVSLTGTIADLNAFIAASGVSWTAAANATANVTLTVAIDDGGNTGSDPGLSGTGSSEASATTVTLVITAVNDAPVNTVPTPQTVLADQTLLFNPGNGNAMTISDVDAGSGTVRVTLTATNGLITLSGTTGLSFLVGSGSSDVTTTFEAAIHDANAALVGLAFSPINGYHGPASLQITTSDLGASGAGGTQTDTDTIAIAVSQGNPAVTGVTAASANGAYKTGDTVTLAASFDQAVTVDTTGGTPSLLLETGLADRAATYIGGSGASTLMFAYTVQAGDISADLDYVSASALALNGATIRSASALDAVLTLATPGSAGSVGGQAAIVVDGVVPTVTSVSVPAAGTYTTGQLLAFGVSFSEAVVVTVAPVLTIGLDTGGPLVATYVSGSGTSSLQFVATVQAGQDDVNGVMVDAHALGGGAVADSAGNAAVLTLTNVGGTSGVLIDTTAPGVTIGAPSVTTTVSGPVTFDVTYTGATSVALTEANVTLISTGTAAATLAVSGTGSTRTVTLSAVSGTGSLAISIAAGTAEDAVGHDAPAVGPSASVSVTARALTAVYPTSGLDSGGVELTLRGVGFTTLVDPAVSFGSAPGGLAEVLDDMTIRVITPPLPAGSATVDAGQILRTGAIDVVLSDASTTVATITGGYLPLARPVDPLSDLDGDTLPDLWELRHGLDAVTASDAALDPDGDGRSNSIEHTAGTHPRGSWIRYFAEGVSNEAMATAFTAFNPGQARSSVVVHYLRDGAGEVTETLDLEPGASVQRTAGQVPGLPGAAYATEIEASVPIVASSLTSWDAAEYGAGAESAVAAASTWYLAEGATKGPFDLFYLLANPNATPIDIDVTYLRPAPSAPLVQRVTVPARQRLTLWVDTVRPELASTDVSAVLSSVGHERFVVERAMYGDDGSGRWGEAGHRAAGVSQPATTWHLAEGYVGGPFDTYLLVANPQATDAAISVEVLGDAGILTAHTHVVAAHSRLTLFAGDLGLPDGPVAFTVRSTNGHPVVVERAMWWRSATGAGRWVESHASTGATAGAHRWGLSDVRIGGARAEAQYVMLLNVEGTTVSVDVTAYLANGQRETRTYAVSASSRLTLDIGAEFPAAVGSTSSLTFISSGAVVVEASRYWDAAGVHWGAGANLRATPLP